MSTELSTRLFEQLESLPLIDPHSHINPHSAASETLADILGYHYYTELAHSSGLSQDVIEEPGISPKELVSRLVPALVNLENTTQYSWLIDLCQSFFGLEDNRLTTDNWEAVYDTAKQKMDQPDWEQAVLKQSKLEGVFLTNDFDDPLSGFDTKFYIPCLRTDDLVFHLTNPSVQQRFTKATGHEPLTTEGLQAGLKALFEHFVKNNAKACAISIPPTFAPAAISDAAAQPLLNQLAAGRVLSSDDAAVLSQYVFWSITENCRTFQLPFDLMIGVHRQVYPAGVYQGQDLFDQRVSLYQYRALFNHFSDVKFPVSVLAQTSNMELVSYSWIFPNVYPNGHWWYSNIPAFIEADTRSRLEAVPQSKLIGYYSDMYKLEFALPKFRMYRRILARVLANEFVIAQGWSEERALELGKRVLRGNVETLFNTGS